MRPRWYRGGPEWLWSVVIAAALALALAWSGWWMVRTTVAAIRSSERSAVLREGDRLAALRWDAERAGMERRLDSLRGVVAQGDTALRVRIIRVRDTSWLPADTSPAVRLVACRAQLDTLAGECDQFRGTATTALAQADSVQRRDSMAFAGLSLSSSARRRADSLVIADLTARTLRQAKWRTAERISCLASLGVNYLQWRAR